MTVSTTTQSLLAWQADPNDPKLAEHLVRCVYAELRAIAAARTRRESAAPFTPTELVHEAWLRMKPPADEPLSCREQFLKLASATMRSVLIDQARERLADKRGGGLQQVTLSWVQGDDSFGDERLLDLDRALDRLAGDHPRVAEVVLLRCFGGLTLEEVAQAQSASLSTVKRDWTFATAWLTDAMRPEV